MKISQIHTKITKALNIFSMIVSMAMTYDMAGCQLLGIKSESVMNMLSCGCNEGKVTNDTICIITSYVDPAEVT